MTDLECFIIESKAWNHLIRCAFSDHAIATKKLTNNLNNLKKELSDEKS